MVGFDSETYNRMMEDFKDWAVIIGTFPENRLNTGMVAYSASAPQIPGILQ
jgi:hypothetical protein